MRASFLFDAMHSSPEWTFVVNPIGESWLVFYMFSPFHTLVNVRKLFLRVWILNAMFFLAEYIISTTIRTSCERSSPSMQPFVPAFPSFSGLFQLVPRCKLSSVQVCSVFIFFWNVLRCSSDFPGQWLPQGWRITFVHPISASPSRLVAVL